MATKPPIPNRTYRHFKGGAYLVLGVARHTSTQEDMVVYEALSSGGLWVRPLTEWVEEVDWPDGQRRGRFILDEGPRRPKVPA